MEAKVDVSQYEKFEDYMDIYSPPGTKVAFVFPNAGWNGDAAWALKHMELGAIRTVRYIEVHSSSSTLYLEEHPKIGFNTVNFAVVK